MATCSSSGGASKSASGASRAMTARNTEVAAKETPKTEEKAVILSSTVRAEPRYEAVREQFSDDRKYQAEEVLRRVMEMERDGKTTGAYTVYDFMGSRKLYGGGYTDFGKVVNEHVKAFKAAGYKVTSREAADSHSSGYRTARGGRVYASTTKVRILHFEKITPKKK